MSANRLDPTLLPALDAVQRAMSRPRTYTPHPAADEPREEEPAHEERDAQEFFLAEQSPSESWFGR